MAAPTAYEKQANASLLQLNPIRQYDGAGGFATLQVSQVGDPNLPQTPLAASLGGTMPSRTSAQLSWTAPNNTGRPALSAVRVWRSQNGAPSVLVTTLAASATSYLDSGLATATPEIVWTYTVQYANSDGQGALSNPVGVQWQGTVVNPPAPILTLDRSGLTQTQVTLVWTEAPDASVLEHGIWEGTTQVRAGIDPTATQYTWTGLAPGSRHANVTVRRRNSALSGTPAGWSTAGPSITFTTTTQTVVHDVVTGIPLNDQWDAGLVQHQQWDAVRCFDIGGSASQVSQVGCRVILLSGDRDVSPTSGATMANRLQTELENFYYPGGNVSAAHANVEIHYCTDNETDRNHTSGNLPQNYIDTVRLCRDVIWRTVGGVRRYPKASMWVDMTHGNITGKGAGPRFKAIAQYLDGFACSMYPPGRDLSKNNNTPTYTPYSVYCDDVIDTLVDWRATGGPGWSYANPQGGSSLAGQLTMYACGEIGIPIDHCANPAGGDNPGNRAATEGEATAATNFSIRPRYLTGGIDSAGTNHKGFMQYIYDACDSNGIIVRELLYWNQQNNADIPNQFHHDRTGRAAAGTGRINTGIDSETAWHDWVPGRRLPNG